MKKHLYALTLCLFVVAATTARAADVSGTWDVKGDVVGNPVNFTCVLKQENEKLSGTATLQGTDTPVTGSVTDGTVTFEFDSGGYHLVFKGTLDDTGGMKGSIAVAGADGTFTATKK